MVDSVESEETIMTVHTVSTSSPTIFDARLPAIASNSAA